VKKRSTGKSYSSLRRLFVELLLLPDVGVVVVARKTELVFNGAGVVVYANVEDIEVVV
jgi:hypothetical protein